MPFPTKPRKHRELGGALERFLVDLYGSQATPTSSIDLERLESPYLNKAFEQSSMSSRSSNCSKISKTSSRNSSRRSSRAASVASSKSLNSTILSDTTLLPDSIISSSSTMDRLRPYSAQNRSRISRPTSGRRPYSAGGRKTPLYMRSTATGIRCTVVKSDDRSRFATLCVSSMLQLLDEATQKLKMTLPARHAFLGDGSEVKSVLEIPRDEPVFVTSSAKSANPKKAARIAKNQVEATKRLSGYNSKTKVRVCANGSGRVTYVLVSKSQFQPESMAPDALEKLFVDVQSSLNLPVKVKALYKWNGKRIKSPHEVLESQEPLWATTGADAFLSIGPLQWYRCCLKKVDNEIKEKDEEDQLLKKKRRALIERIKKLETRSNEEEERGADHRLKNIPVVHKDHRLVSSSSSFKLRIYENGAEDILLVVVVNFDQLHKEGTRCPENDGLQLLMQNISDKLYESKQKRYKIKKLFNSQGIRLTELEEIEKDMEIWISDGEPFITAETEKIVLDVQQVRALDEDGELYLLEEGRIQDPKEELPNASIKNWTPVKGVDFYDFEDLESKADVAPDIRHKIQQQEEAVNAESTFLRHENALLSCHVTVRESVPIWPQKANLWRVRPSTPSNGTFRGNVFVILAFNSPKLALTINGDHSVTLKYISEEDDDPCQTWIFTSTGRIKNLFTGDKCLSKTDSGALMMLEPGEVSKSYQTWAIQEPQGSSTQWDKTGNAFYRRKALCWPVSSHEQMCQYRWPLVGELFTNVHYKKIKEESENYSDAEEKRIRVILNENHNESKWLTIRPDTNLHSFFTAEMELKRPVRRIWTLDGTQSDLVSKYDQVESRSTLVLCTRNIPKKMSAEALEANLSSLRYDKNLIKKFIETRDILGKEMFVTADRVKNGSVVVLKPKNRQFHERLSFEEKERKNAARWNDGEVETVEEEPEISNQQFLMERSGHIVAKQNRKLVLATEKGRKVERGLQVIMQAKSSDEAGQIWERHGAAIRNVVNPDLVLTAVNNRMVLDKKAKNDFGSIHQKFEFDKNGGIRVAVGDSKELDLTAAVNTGICTYCICANEELQQFGYLEDGMHFCQICAPLVPGVPSSQRMKVNRAFLCSMGEAELNQHSLRISPFRYINRPRLDGENALKALQEVSDLLKQAEDQVSTDTGNIKLKLYRNHTSESSLTVVARSLDAVRLLGERHFSFIVKRMYFSNGKCIFDWAQIKRAAEKCELVEVWLSAGAPFSKTSTTENTTEFLKITETSDLYSQGSSWKRVAVTLDKKSSNSATVILQGRNMLELMNSATQLLKTNYPVEALIAEDGRVFSADEDFENLPESKSVKEARESSILEVKYKFKLDPSERKTSRNHELNKKK